MRWPRWWRRSPTPRAAVSMPDPVDVADAVAARQRAEALLARDRRRGAEIREVTTRARREAAANHFAQLIAESFRST